MGLRGVSMGLGIRTGDGDLWWSAGRGSDQGKAASE